MMKDSEKLSEMSHTRILTIKYFGLILILGILVPIVNGSPVCSEFNDVDRSKINKLMFGQELSRSDVYKGQDEIILSTENIRDDLVPKMKGIKIKLLKPEDINEKTKRENSLVYLAFTKFNIEGCRAEVSFEKNYKTSSGYSSSLRFTYKFRKVNGRLILEK